MTTTGTLGHAGAITTDKIQASAITSVTLTGDVYVGGKPPAHTGCQAVLRIETDAEHCFYAVCPAVDHHWLRDLPLPETTSLDVAQAQYDHNRGAQS